ncbi:hypothetical protein AB1Y20_006099 [Prymnesium parvum]|uniref:Methyltransferase FkbM domain-containing protein n=1 Tax=Prymnesium parvum TaxID=97485 RepID=A0AB34J1R5_PRYPA
MQRRPAVLEYLASAAAGALLITAFYHVTAPPPPPALAASCSPPREDYERSYAAPRYFPFPPFRIVLETSPGECDLGAPAYNGSRRSTRAERQAHCRSFERGGEMMPEPFVVQVIASFLAHCPYTPAGCIAVDVGGNLGIHTAYMASLGARVDVVEPAVDLVAAIGATVRANCWGGRVAVHANGITARAADEGRAAGFAGGWRLDDRAGARRRRHEMTLLALPTLLRKRRVDLLKIDIDNSAIEMELLVELERMTAVGEADVRAFVVEVSASSARDGRAKPLARVLSRLQQQHGYHAYRLAHHLHTMDNLEPYYSPCYGARAIKYMLHIRPLRPQQWMQLLQTRRDLALGRSDTSSYVFTKEAVGQGAEANWNSASMDKTMPRAWREARCGAGSDGLPLAKGRGS